MRAFAVLAGLMLAEVALACGYCVEDKIAAAYDHSVVVRAAERQHKVAFLSVEGVHAKTLEGTFIRAVQSTPGVDAGSVRVSLEGGALSFAFDPSRHSLSSIVEGIQKKVAAKGVEVSVLRVLRD